MKRFACIAVVCLVATLGSGVSSVQAQVLPADDSKMYAELNAGPTLGHKSDKFFGVEGGYRLTGDLDIFAEYTHMGNVATSDLDDRAAVIADFLGGTATTAFKVDAFVVGVKYNLALSPMVHPYVLAGVGVAHVKTEVEFNVGGSTVDPGGSVSIGADLSGSANKTMLVIGFGVHLPFKTRFYGDLGYRYGQIFANTSNFETDTSIPTQRVILGVGVKF
jgi:opacity protein-like surface antigen